MPSLINAEYVRQMLGRGDAFLPTPLPPINEQSQKILSLIGLKSLETNFSLKQIKTLLVLYLLFTIWSEMNIFWLLLFVVKFYSWFDVFKDNCPLNVSHSYQLIIIFLFPIFVIIITLSSIYHFNSYYYYCI